MFLYFCAHKITFHSLMSLVPRAHLELHFIPMFRQYLAHTQDYLQWMVLRELKITFHSIVLQYITHTQNYISFSYFVSIFPRLVSLTFRANWGLYLIQLFCQDLAHTQNNILLDRFRITSRALRILFWLYHQFLAHSTYFLSFD